MKAQLKSKINEFFSNHSEMEDEQFTNELLNLIADQTHYGPAIIIECAKDLTNDQLIEFKDSWQKEMQREGEKIVFPKRMFHASKKQG